ncbi:hypothetical protein BDR06DRAFT_1010815 [Suillus hirtellus]|nr:hypothetical protein BDR06DRAFT_1010815 [Suillus hirtellus]
MAPRKGKKKATNDEDNDKVASTSNTFKLNTRPVQATLTKDDVALEKERRDAAVEAAKIGMGKINILTIANMLKFGTYNDRLKNNTHVNKMIASFEKNGIQWGTQTNALPIVIERSRIAPGQTLEGSWTDSTTLKDVKFTDHEPLIFASGQHRVAALKKYTKRYTDEAEEIQARLTHLEGKGPITKEEAEEHEDARIRLGDVKGHLNRLGNWGVVLYDKEILEEGKAELAHHLSRNETLHNYNETQEEEMILILRNMRDAYNEKGREGALQVLQRENDTPTHTPNSKLTKVLKNHRLVMTLAMDLLPMGEHFRPRREFMVRWLAQSINVVMGMYTMYISNNFTMLRLLASKDEDFPTYRELQGLMKRRDADPDARNVLAGLSAKIQSGEDGNVQIFLPLIEEIDKIAVKCFEAYEGTIGDENDDYTYAITNYRDDVVDLLQTHWLAGSKRSKEETKWLERVIARTYVWLSPSDKTVAYPLITGMVMDRVWKELERVQEGYKETVRWFECMVDTMKITTPNTHAIDDLTEAMFCSIERNRRINARECIDMIWLELMQGRSTSVLHLHNAMSAIPMQAKMATRPTKKNFQEKWAATSESTKQKAKVLLDAVSKYVGKGDIDIPVSAMNTVGMPAFMSTGWDWRRLTIRKNRDRSIDPAIQAIIMELEFAQTYRPDLLQDPIIWALRATLHTHILDHQTKSLLNPATAGSLAQRQDWQFWDGINIHKPSGADVIDSDAHLSAEEVLRRRSVVTAHRNALLHLVKIVTDMPIAHVTPHKDSGIDMHVAYYTNKLVKAIESSGSRHCLRDFSGIDTKQYDAKLHNKPYGIPPVVGVRDVYTVYRTEDELDEDEEPLIEDQSGTHEEESAPKTNKPKPRPKAVQSTLPSQDKGKAKEITPAPVIQDKRTTSDIATSSNPSDLFSPELQDKRDVADARMEVDDPVVESRMDSTQEDSASVVQTVSDLPFDPSSPLSSPPPEDSLGAGLGVPPPVVQKSAPRAAPAASCSAGPSKSVARSVTSPSVRASLAPSEMSASSKRARQDATLMSPDNKKKRKSKAKSNVVDNDDDVDVIPDM